MKDYYQILQVHRGANSSEIKKAYRRLAVKFHPDKNPDVSAEHLFKEINEAYEVLGDPTKKISYDLLATNPYEPVVIVPERKHRDPAYRRNRPRVNHKSERQRLYESMLPWLPLANRIAYFSFIITIFLAVDYLLPFERRFETIIEADVKTYRRSVTEWLVLITDKGNSLELPLSNARYFHVGDPIIIEATRLLKVPIYVQGTTAQVRFLKSIYGIFSFVPIALFISSSYGIYYRKRADYGFNAGLITFLILVITTIIYILID
jgi:hypothetical protein